MPKPILKPLKNQTRSDSILSITEKQEQKQTLQQADKMKLDRLLRKPRSKEYMDTIAKLDAGGHVHNQNQVKEIIDAIKNEFPELDMDFTLSIFLGIIARCYLGDPYEVHTLDTANQIIEHYKRGEALPGNLEKARSIAIRGGYSFIEVYTDCCRAISLNGTVSVIPN